MYDLSEMEASAVQLNDELSRWDGCVCQLWAYGLSHPTFTFQVYRDGRPTSLTVFCISPRDYCGPVGWGRARLRVTAEQADPLNLLVLRDEAARFTLRCGTIQLKEGPPPHWVRGERDAPAVDSAATAAG